MRWTARIIAMGLLTGIQPTQAEHLRYCSWVMNTATPTPVVELRLDRDGALYWNNERIEPKLFTAYLSQLMTQPPPKAAFIVKGGDPRGTHRLLSTIRGKGLPAETDCTPSFPIPAITPSSLVH